LTLVAITIALALGLPLGLVAGYWPRAIAGRLVSLVSIIGISLPTFWIGLTLITVFSIGQGWFPTGGRGPVGTILGASSSLFTLEGLRHLVLPALNLSLFPLAMVIRLTRAGVLETISSPHIRFAKAKGLSPARILARYILPSIAIPIITVVGILFGVLLAYGIVTETVFAWPGIGKLIIDSIRNSDRPVIIAYIQFTVILFLIINLAVDLACAMIDPRISLAEAR
jgi:peptide/nickel transport system permease protein